MQASFNRRMNPYNKNHKVCYIEIRNHHEIPLYEMPAFYKNGLVAAQVLKKLQVFYHISSLIWYRLPQRQHPKKGVIITGNSVLLTTSFSLENVQGNYHKEAAF